MSARTSFDIQPRGRATKPPPTAKKERTRRKHTPKKSLKARRSEQRTALRVVVALFFLLILGGIVYAFWRPEIRIISVETIATPEAASEVVRQTLVGTYFGLIPRDSVFFYPEKEVRAALLDAYPSLAAVSVSRASFTALTIEGTRRVAAFYWCGGNASEFSVSGAGCYEADTEGLVFAHAEAMLEGSTTPMLRIYAPLEESDSTTYPLRGRVVGASYLPNLLQFVRAVKSLGIPVLSTAIQNDEAELFVSPTTRIKYVLGDEEEAARSAEAALPTLNLLDGSIEYADLRFEGKVYVKRYGE